MSTVRWQLVSVPAPLNSFMGQCNVPEDVRLKHRTFRNSWNNETVNIPMKLEVKAI